MHKKNERKSRRLIGKLEKLWKPKTYKEFFAYYFGGLYNRADDHHIFLLASGLAFSLFVCIVPLVLIIFSVLGVILERPSVADEITTFIDRAIPYKDYATFVKDKVFARVDEFRVFKNLAGVIGFVGLFIASSGLFSSMRTVLHLVYRRKSREPALIGKLRDFALVLMVLVYFLLTTAILPALEVVGGFAEKIAILESFRLGFMEDLALGAASFLIVYLAFFVLYWAIPHGKLPRRVTFVSAMTAAVLWEIAKQLFGAYITNVVTLKNVYGAYVLMVIVAFWVYYSAIVFILGAEVGQLFRERKYAGISSHSDT
jgi:membrane protein